MNLKYPLFILILSSMFVSGLAAGSDTGVYVVTLKAPSANEHFKPLSQIKQSKADKAAHEKLLIESRSEEIAKAQADFLDKLYGGSALYFNLSNARLRRLYQTIPAVTIEASPELAEEISKIDGVVSVRAQRTYKLLLEKSVPFIGANEFWEAFGEGEGVASAVLDTGVTFLGDVGKKCHQDGELSQLTAAIIEEIKIATSDGPECHLHADIVTGIVNGVAPKAKIISVDVFTYMGGGSKDPYLAYDEDIIAGLDWAIANRAKYNITSINMSLGGGDFEGYCPESSSGEFEAIDALHKLGVVVAVASGNENMERSVGTPSCIYPAVSVGACYDTASMGGKAASFSNQSPIVAFMAPGVNVDAGGVDYASGTSMAAPHVAGAAALWTSYLLRANEGRDVPRFNLAEQTIARLLFKAEKSVSNHVDYDWSWPLLKVLPVSNAQIIPVISYAEGESLTIGDCQDFSFNVESEDKYSGLERLAIWLDLGANSPTSYSASLIAPDGASYDFDLPDAVHGDVRMVLGTFIEPEIGRAFENSAPNGRWRFILCPKNGAYATVKNLYFMLQPSGSAALKAVSLSPKPESADLRASTFGLTMSVYNFSSTVSCKAIVTAENPHGFTETLEAPIEVAAKSSQIDLSAKLPTPLIPGSYVFEASIMCEKNGVFRETEKLTTVSDIEPQTTVISQLDGDDVVKSVETPLNFNYKISNPNPWSVCCDQKLVVSKLAKTLYEDRACLLPGASQRNFTADASSLWKDGSSFDAYLMTSCEPNPVEGSEGSFKFTTVKEPFAKLVVKPDVVGYAPYKVTLSAETQGVVDSIKWTLSDGTTVVGKKSVEITLSDVGAFTQMVTVENKAGTFSAEEQIKVFDAANKPATKDRSSKGGCAGGSDEAHSGLMVILTFFFAARFAFAKFGAIIRG